MRKLLNGVKNYLRQIRNKRRFEINLTMETAYCRVTQGIPFDSSKFEKFRKKLYL